MKGDAVLRWFSLLFLVGCPFVSDRGFDDIRDQDGDGSWSTRFDGPDCQDLDPTITDCDVDGDESLSIAAGGDDCDDTNAQIFPGAIEQCGSIDRDCDGRIGDDDDVAPDRLQTFYQDLDRDGVGDPDASIDACVAPAGFVDIPGDCDDNSADIAPGLPERCDGQDNDCDGLIDDDDDAVTNPVSWGIDVDGDGFLSANPDIVLQCDAPAQGIPTLAQLPIDCDDSTDTIRPNGTEVPYNGIDEDCDGLSDDEDVDADGIRSALVGGEDCDDNAPGVGTGLPEVCDGIDNDCDGLIDDADPGVDTTTGTIYFLDADQDGFGGVVELMACANPDADRYAELGDDCDDQVPDIRPGASEFCNGVDDDCNGQVDEGAVDSVEAFADFDGDGFGNDAQLVRACSGAPNVAFQGGDCNDADEMSFPGAEEICGDAIRQDCRPIDPLDCDADGVLEGEDCDDTDADVAPGRPEVCDGLDNDCDGLLDDEDDDVDPSTAQDWFLDTDQDGIGAGEAIFACSPPTDSVSVDGDCDDTRDDVGPDQPEVCDGVDNDCDGQIDGEDPDADGLTPFFRDADDDGFGDDAQRVLACEEPFGVWSTVGGDCNDAEGGVFPGATEVCNGRDDDCDVLIDDEDPSRTGAETWFADADGDGFTLAAVFVEACAPPAGFGIPSDRPDCNDNNQAVNPGASETCNGGVDDDCDGLSDAEDDDLTLATWYPDVDGDGFGSMDDVGQTDCTQPAGFVANALDCDDTERLVSPDAPEICDGLDNDCDTEVDDDDADVDGAPLVYPDLDQDGAGDRDADPTLRCEPGPMEAFDPTDCDDTNENIGPDAPEVCDGLDNDCDELTDDGDPGVEGKQIWRVDADQDGFADLAATEAVQCAPPGAGWTALAPRTDCDDTNAARSPAALEIPYNGVDEDCVAGNDLDVDGDGVNGPGTAIEIQGPGIQVGSDCDDNDAGRNPQQIEVYYDGVDADCSTGVAGLGFDLLDYDRDGDGSVPESERAEIEDFWNASAPYTGAYVLFGDCDDDPTDDPPDVASLRFQRADQIHPNFDPTSIAWPTDGTAVDRSRLLRAPFDERERYLGSVDESPYDGVRQACDSVDDYDADGDDHVAVLPDDWEYPYALFGQGGKPEDDCDDTAFTDFSPFTNVSTEPELLAALEARCNGEIRLLSDIGLTDTLVVADRPIDVIGDGARRALQPVGATRFPLVHVEVAGLPHLDQGLDGEDADDIDGAGIGIGLSNLDLQNGGAITFTLAAGLTVGPEARARLTDVRFIDNEASQGHGAIYLQEESSLTGDGVTFSGNVGTSTSTLVADSEVSLDLQRFRVADAGLPDNAEGVFVIRGEPDALRLSDGRMLLLPYQDDSAFSMDSSARAPMVNLIAPASATGALLENMVLEFPYDINVFQPADGLRIESNAGDRASMENLTLLSASDSPLMVSGNVDISGLCLLSNQLMGSMELQPGSDVLLTDSRIHVDDVASNWVIEADTSTLELNRVLLDQPDGGRGVRFVGDGDFLEGTFNDVVLTSFGGRGPMSDQAFLYSEGLPMEIPTVEVYQPFQTACNGPAFYTDGFCALAQDGVPPRTTVTLFSNCTPDRMDGMGGYTLGETSSVCEPTLLATGLIDLALPTCRRDYGLTAPPLP